MREIFHLVEPAVWERDRQAPYRPASLETEGFIHCSSADQVARVANLFYAGAQSLLVLRIDADRLGALLRDEDIGTGEKFPHVYGPLNRGVVVDVCPLTRGPDGKWTFPTPGEA
jgi:uncharacterized protein (DUF952 family)